MTTQQAPVELRSNAFWGHNNAPIHKAPQNWGQQQQLPPSPAQQAPPPAPPPGQQPPPMPGAAPMAMAEERVNPLNMTHRHAGRPQDHPVGYRHRKESADPLHKQEDSLFDELRQLADKADSGNCTPMEVARLREVQGSLAALQHQRLEAAKAILGQMMQQQHGSSPVDNAAPLTGPSQPSEAAKPATGPENANASPDAFNPADAHQSSGFNPDTAPQAQEQPAPPPRPATPTAEQHEMKGQPAPFHGSYSPPEQKPVDSPSAKVDNEANETGAPMQQPNPGPMDPAGQGAMTPPAPPRAPKPVTLG